MLKKIYYIRTDNRFYLRLEVVEQNFLIECKIKITTLQTITLKSISFYLIAFPSIV